MFNNVIRLSDLAATRALEVAPRLTVSAAPEYVRLDVIDALTDCAMVARLVLMGATEADFDSAYGGGTLALGHSFPVVVARSPWSVL